MSTARAARRSPWQLPPSELAEEASPPKPYHHPWGSHTASPWKASTPQVTDGSGQQRTSSLPNFTVTSRGTSSVKVSFTCHGTTEVLARRAMLALVNRLARVRV